MHTFVTCSCLKSRGELVQEEALAAALRAERLRKAYLDVLCKEPPAADNPLLRHPNAFVTPHVAWGTAESLERCRQISIDNVKAWAEGRQLNRLDL
jgi:glycerate dehydrogenase